VGTQPDAATVRPKLDSLITDLCNGACGGQRTLDVAKAACGAALGSATTMIQ
jgi:hypothetical protein